MRAAAVAGEAVVGEDLARLVLQALRPAAHAAIPSITATRRITRAIILRRCCQCCLPDLCIAGAPAYPISLDLTTKTQQAKAQLDAHVREIVEWHFNPATGCPFWLEFAAKLTWDPRKEIQLLRRPEEIPAVSGRMAARRPGPPLGSQGPRRQADLRLRNRRHHRHPQEPRGDRGFPHRLRAVQRDAARQVFSAGRQLADARPLRPAPAAAGRRASVPASRRHLLLRRSRSALGDQADQEGLDGGSGSVQGARHRPGDHDSAAGHDIHCMFTTPKLLEALAEELENRGTSIRETGITGIFSGGTEFTPQWTASPSKNCWARAST